jgi:Reverse transcriptase (RNA-dependent DNA polymerase)
MKSEDADKWMEAIHSELVSLREMRTWELVDKKEVPGDARILPCKLVLKIKTHEDGTIERYKARVVVLGNLQQVGVDYDLTFAPVIDFTIVRLMLAVASRRDMQFIIWT